MQKWVFLPRILFLLSARRTENEYYFGRSGYFPRYKEYNEILTTLEIEWESPLFIRRENPEPTVLSQLDSKPRIMGSANLGKIE